MTSRDPNLTELGWRPFFNAQLSADEVSRFSPVRVMAVHRGKLTVAGAGPEALIPSRISHAEPEEDHPTVGDWLLIDRETGQTARIFHRASLFKRPAPGAGRRLQLIAANVDTLFIVTSCNEDFNIARLERYLVLAREAGVTPIVVVTKADLTDTPEEYVKLVRDLQPGLLVEIVDARDPASAACLSAWCGIGQTVALLGSSGVGKSTLINTLRGSEQLATQQIRDDDAKGRHTTTGRTMHRLDNGGWLLDTPGMRELQLSDAATGLADVFDDIVTLAQHCRFSDCSHDAEPGCAVKAAIAAGTLDPRRHERWRKLAAEDAFNTETQVQRRARNRSFGKMVQSVQKEKKQRNRQ